MQLTLKEAVDGFRKQWNWIADETLWRKRKVKKKEYFEEENIESPTIDCYLCELSLQCQNCPVEWGGKIGTCLDKNAADDGEGLFVRFMRSTDYKKAARLAREIANLPLKEKYIKEYENAID